MLLRKIKENSIEYGSIPFWSWNDKLDPKRLRAQIRDMKRIGMNGFFMHARGGLETEYLSDDWYECIAECVDEAKKLGMEAWSYDENGWPSGFAGGLLLEDKKNHASFIEYKIEDSFPKDALAVYQIDEKTIKKLDRQEEGIKEYFAVYQGFDSSYVDTLDADITKEFIKLTHEEYKRVLGEDFGTNMPGFFTDEPQYYRYKTPWSNKLRSTFIDKYSYDLFDYLPALLIDFEENDDFDFKSIRFDYYYLVHEMFINNFIKVVYDWCNDNNCQLTGHAVEEAKLAFQMWSSGGAMPFYEYEHIPGIDFLGRNIANDIAPKQVGSVASQLGKKKVLSEMFGCCGWDVSPYELMKIANWQYVSGVNLMCQHLYPYSIRGQRKRDYPAFYSEHLPWQEQMADFNIYFKRLGYLLAQGKEEVNTLIIHPMHSSYLTYDRKKDIASIQELEDAFAKITNEFSENQIAYHYGDEIIMSKYASVNDDGTMTVGQASYDYLVLPVIYSLDSSTVSLLKDYLAKGGKLFIYGDLPTRIDGKKADLSFLKSNTSFEEIKDRQIVKLSKEGKNLPALRVMTRDTQDGRVFYILNLSDHDIDGVKLQIKDRGNLSLLNLMTLEYEGTIGDTISFERGQALILVEKASDKKLDLSIKDFKKTKLEGEFKLAKPLVNTINLDYAYLSYDGKEYEARRPVMHIKDLLFQRRYKGDIHLKFDFYVEEIPNSLKLSYEPLNYKSISLNGKDLKELGEYFLDESFKTADLMEAVKLGLNELVFQIDYFQDDYVYYVLYGGVSESLRNCLNFDTEIESVYLYGDFAVITEDAFSLARENVLEYTGTFKIGKQGAFVDASNIVCDGYPFYSGKMTVTKTFNVNKLGDMELILEGRYSLCDVYVNGKKASRLMYVNHCDISDFIRLGDNDLVLEFFNSNRNLLGPHHFIDPEPLALGPGHFSLENMWTQEGSHAHRDRYSFVRFGANVYLGR